MPCCCHRQVPSNGGEGRVKIVGFVGFIGNGRELFHRYIGMSPSNPEYDRHILNYSPRAWTSADTSKQGIQGLKKIVIHLLKARCTSIWEYHPDRRTIPFSRVSGTTIEPIASSWAPPPPLPVPTPEPAPPSVIPASECVISSRKSFFAFSVTLASTCRTATSVGDPSAPGSSRPPAPAPVAGPWGAVTSREAAISSSYGTQVVRS